MILITVSPMRDYPNILIQTFNQMEQLNRIELRGSVGSIRIQKISGTNVANFTVATNLAYRSKDGTPIIETTWHNVTAWEDNEIRDLDKLKKGCKVHVIGRLRCQRYTGTDGVERAMYEVAAKSLALIEDTEVLQYQM